MSAPTRTERTVARLDGVQITAIRTLNDGPNPLCVIATTDGGIHTATAEHITITKEVQP